LSNVFLALRGKISDFFMLRAKKTKNPAAVSYIIDRSGGKINRKMRCRCKYFRAAGEKAL